MEVDKHQLFDRSQLRCAPPDELARLLGIDNQVSDQWGRMSAIRPVPVIDGLLAATAVAHGLTLATAGNL